MYIFGASGHGKAVIELAEIHSIVDGVFDDNPIHTHLLGYSIFNSSKGIESSAQFFIAIGDNHNRREVYKRLGVDRFYGTLIHPSAIVSQRSLVGQGTVIMEGAIIKVNAVIGNQVIINTAASVDHDCVVGDFVHIAPRATLCGGASIGEGTIVGAGSVVTPYVKIGSWCKISAGSVVNRDIPDGAIWVGTGLKGQ